MALNTYSFLDVHASINGPGGSFAIGAGAGNAEEGITIEASQDVNAMLIGADGSGMHSLVADKSGKITVRLLKTSPVNQLLEAMLAYQRTSGANWGQNTITIVNTTSGDSVTAQQVAFVRQPNITYAKEGGIMEWPFEAITIDPTLGDGTLT
jgi:hypothetical protein